MGNAPPRQIGLDQPQHLDELRETRSNAPPLGDQTAKQIAQPRPAWRSRLTERAGCGFGQARGRNRLPAASEAHPAP